METKIRDFELSNGSVVSIYKQQSSTPLFMQSYIFKLNNTTWKCDVVLASPILTRIDGDSNVIMTQFYNRAKCDTCQHVHRIHFTWSDSSATLGTIEQCIMCMHRPDAFDSQKINNQLRRM